MQRRQCVSPYPIYSKRNAYVDKEPLMFKTKKEGDDQVSILDDIRATS